MSVFVALALQCLTKELGFNILKRHGPFVAFYFYCKIMSYSINYTYYSNIKICFHVPFGVENRRSKGCLTLFTHRPRGVFETDVGMAKIPEGNA